MAGLDAIPEEGTSPLTREDMTTPTIKIEGSTPTHQSKDEPRTPQPDDPSTTQEPSEGIPPTEGTSPVPPEEGATLEARPSDPSPEPVEDHTPSPLDSVSGRLLVLTIHSLLSYRAQRIRLAPRVMRPHPLS